MKTTHARLADGRELIYFDESDDAVRVMVDPRHLAPSEATSTVRHDPVLGEWVALAGHRQDRTYLPPDERCPLCPSRDGRQSEIPSPDYDVVVFENRFPSFVTVDNDAETAAPRPPDRADIFVEEPGSGRCEVVCFTAEHDASFSSLPPSRVRTVMEAWVDRTCALSALPEVEQVFCFENRGEEIGVTLSHPHGQIYGYPFVTPRTQRMLARAGHYFDATGSNLFSDRLGAEISDGRRLVARTRHWAAFVPFAARWPLEVHLYPTRAVPDLPELTEEERADFSEIYLDVLARMEGVFEDPLPYIAAWHQAPVRSDRHLAYLHLEVFSPRRAPGKLKYLAGSESAMDA
ncbi:MAG: galactose-1-phosphate uridylyltransferase, partial [Acidimicrobiales bacterium]